jgi:hypothetical protein
VIRALLKWFALTALFLVFLVVAAVLLIWVKPGLVINTAMLQRVLPHLTGTIKVRWSSLELTAESPSFFRKRLQLKGRDLCVGYAEEGLDNCFRSVDVQAEVDISSFSPKYRVGPIAILGGDLNWNPPPEPKNPPPAKAKTESKNAGLFPQLPSILRQVSLEPVRLEWDRVVYRTAAGNWTGAVRLAAKPDGTNGLWDLVASARMPTQGKVYKGSVDLHVESLESPWFGPYVGRGTAMANLPGNKKISARFRASPVGVRSVQFAVDAGYRQGKQNIQLGIHGQGGLDGVRGSLTGEGRSLVNYLPKINLRRCPFSYGQSKTSAKKAEASLDCEIIAGTDFPNLNPKYSSLVKTVPLRLKTSATMPSSGNDGETTGKLQVLMDPLLAQLKRGRGALDVDFHGRLDDFPKHLDVATRLALDVGEFQEVVQALEGFPWAVPNPLRTLKGNVHLDVTSQGKLSNGEIRLPISLQTHLASRQQKLGLNGTGELVITGIGKKAHANLDFKLSLSDVKLVLPYMALAAPPRLTPDSRIRVPPELTETAKERERQLKSSKEPPAFTYHVEIVTPSENPVRLISNLAKSEIPLVITIHMVSGSSPTGSIRVSNFQVELFRRVATLQHFFVRLTPNPDNIEVNGEVQVVYTDYTVQILILGLASAPEIKFTSVPPLPEKDVLAVLLFGKKIDALDSGQAQSVGSTNAAVADSAVSLASMYLLASTPVESVGYDSTTGVFNAKVRLADGTSLNVGSDLSHLNQVGLRKRLGGDWYLNTYLSNPLQSAGQSLTTFLEWSRAY